MNAAHRKIGWSWLLAAIVIGLFPWGASAAPKVESPVVGSGPPASKLELPEGAVHGLYATTVGRSQSEFILVHYWSSGARFRSETIISGHPIVTLVNGKYYYTWDRLTGEGYRVGRSPQAIAADKGRLRPFGLELQEILEDGGEKIRSETLNGIPVDIYRVTDDAGKRTLWVDAGRMDLPVRLESYSRSSGRTGRLDWLNWNPNLIMAETFFNPPKGLEITRFDSYEKFLERLMDGPVAPTPPLFLYLLHTPDGGPPE
ncbi:MAG: hypothetical protein CBC48_00675 [bacterium TMED88]|nr:hypothetical protein [Deltaproteobacteria bacterium]OUV37329.1 MAG: hypothetical protein CBC48_00675 [bacterium TMED88]